MKLRGKPDLRRVACRSLQQAETQRPVSLAILLPCTVNIGLACPGRV